LIDAFGNSIARSNAMANAQCSSPFGTGKENDDQLSRVARRSRRAKNRGARLKMTAQQR
jgi:hypothetical protein